MGQGGCSSGREGERSFGAVGDGVTDDTEAIQAAFDAAAEAGGGTVLFPAGGVYFTLPFHFSGSHTAIELPLGARVVFSNDKSKYANSSGITNLMSAVAKVDVWNQKN